MMLKNNENLHFMWRQEKFFNQGDEMLLEKRILDISDSIFRIGICFCCTYKEQTFLKVNFWLFSFSQMMLKSGENLHFMWRQEKFFLTNEMKCCLHLIWFFDILCLNMIIFLVWNV